MDEMNERELRRLKSINKRDIRKIVKIGLCGDTCVVDSSGYPAETDDFFLAVKQDDLKELKHLVELETVNKCSILGYSLLEYTIQNERVEIFDYLLTLEDLEIDHLDVWKQSSLLFSVEQKSDNQYFVLELIKNGANIHLKDDEGETVLHKMYYKPVDIRRDVLRLLIETGADLNVQNNKGETPLYLACFEGDVDWIYAFLYYGALATIPSFQENLSIEILYIDIPQEERLHLEDILFDCTFDASTNPVPLATLVRAMSLRSNLFTRIVEVASDVISYEAYDLKRFIKRFSVFPTQERNKTLQLVLEGVGDFIETCDLSRFTIGKLVLYHTRNYFKDKIETDDEEIFKIVYTLLTYGFNVNSQDLNIIHSNYGYCELFEVLLHMDIQMNDNIEWTIARLYYDPRSKVKLSYNVSSEFVKLLCYYNHPKLKKKCLKSVNEEVAAKAETLPPLPSLVELSRNVLRCYIIRRYNVKNSMWFYTILKSLPIDETTRKIIALEIPLYP